MHLKCHRCHCKTNENEWARVCTIRFALVELETYINEHFMLATHTHWLTLLTHFAPHSNNNSKSPKMNDKIRITLSFCLMLSTSLPFSLLFTSAIFFFLDFSNFPGFDFNTQILIFVRVNRKSFWQNAKKEIW